MISSRAINSFLDRSLDNFDWLKKHTPAQINAALNGLKPKPDFGKIKPWLHQKVLLLIIMQLKRFMLLIDMGGGKSLTVLLIIKYRKQRGEQPRAVIFVPYITSVETWIDDAEKHTPELHCVPLLGSGLENLERLQGPGDLFVICYQSAVAMVTETAFSKKKQKNVWRLEAEQVREYFVGFDMLVMDEVHKCGKVTSLTYRMCRALSAQAEYVLGLTGTPFGRDLLALWPQFYLIDFGEALGDTLGFYREVFFAKKKKYFGGFGFTFKKRLMPTLRKMVKHSSINYNVDEFADMPPYEHVPIYLKPPEANQGYIDAAIATIKAEVVGGARYRVVESQYLQLRQLSSGFMTLKGEDSERLQIEFEENPKLDALEALIESMPPDCKMIVFHHFVYTNNLISKRLKQMKVGHARVWGKAKDPIGEIRKFKTDPDCRVLVINSKSGSSSLNLQNAQYICFFEQPESSIDRIQGEARVWRSGQTKKVFIYDLLMKETIDSKLHNANKEGRKLLDSLLRGEDKL